MELVGQLRNHMLQMLGLVRWGHFRGTNYGFFVLRGLRITLFRLERLTVSELVRYSLRLVERRITLQYTQISSLSEHTWCSHYKD